MIKSLEAIVLRQTKTVGHRRMILLLSDREGVISAGTSISESGKGKSALAIRPFTYGRFQISSNRERLGIAGAETLKYFYGIGEDAEKLVQAAGVMEMISKTLPEGAPAREHFCLLLRYLELLETRKSAFGTLTAACLVKFLMMSGILPDRDNFYSDELLSNLSFDIVNVFAYLMEQPFDKMENLVLEDSKCDEILRLIKRYARVHLEIGALKSDISLDM